MGCFPEQREGFEEGSDKARSEKKGVICRGMSGIPAVQREI
jgi:hypothetical protein